MRLLRRSVAFVLSLLVVQLTLAGSTVSCAAYGEARSAYAGDHGMRGEMPQHSAAKSPSAHTSHEHADGGCTPRSMPGDCSMPAPCAAPSLATGSAAAFAVAVASHIGWTEIGDAPPAPPSAPEIPPPRA